MSILVYYSSPSENTHRFVQKLGLPALRIPTHPVDADPFIVDQPYILVVPTYGAVSYTHLTLPTSDLV